MKKLVFYPFLLSLAACSNVDLEAQLPDNRPDYKTSTTINPLEIPPDLTQSSMDDTLVVPELSGVDNAQLSDYQKERTGTHQQAGQLTKTLANIHNSGDATWIELANTRPDNVFKDAKSFWTNNGLPLSRIDSNIGIMETDWLEANNNLPRTGISGMLMGLLNGLRDNGVRDKFRTRIDYDGKNTYVYMTHYGATEEAVDEQGKKIKNNKGQKIDPNYTWIASSRNAELEVEMLRRLNLYLQKSGKQSATAAPSQRTKRGTMQFLQLSDGTPALAIDSDFNQAWVMLGIAIDRAGYEISRQDRKNGTYQFAKITDKESGFIFSEVTRSITNYNIGVANNGKQSLAIVRSIDEKAPSVEAAQAILQKISKEIRF